MAAGTLKVMSEELSVIRSEMLGVEEQFLASVDDLPETTRASACNLLHYLALRRHDVRPLQGQLAARGLSAFGQAESEALRSVTTLLDVVGLLDGRAPLDGPSGMHQRKKTAMLRQLGVADRFFSAA